ncbi:MAG TPA: threonine--tRNA ligase [Steroidobacteraceae bacterium]|jgi:threonyl-tRNA synthetase|nr:threonine--tRNA ligase [Steroidobacteraceae bacterium]
MPVVTLPDGSQRRFERPVTVDEVAGDIGAGLRKAALAGRVDGKLVDTSFTIDGDASVAIVTDKDPAGLEVIRHSTAHLLAQAVKQLFPEAQVTIGPVIEDGFYYDFAYQRPFTPEDLAAIEARMAQLAKADEKVTRRVMGRDEAVAFFESLGEHYKAQIIGSIPAGEQISLYGQGDGKSDWVDLCRGPHVPSTGKLKAFKLTKLAGAYWRGDSRNEMLQRIYGTAWPDKKQLDEYLHRLEEAEKRDHRRIGRELDLFHLQEEAPGAVFWHPKGWSVFQTLIGYMRERQRAAGYEEVNAPELMDITLWEASGHREKFGENMFLTETPDQRVYAIKPMNCPGHVQIFKHGLRSYRELPVRFAEFGKVHRYEPSGALHGLMRVRAFTQDDGHVFVTEDQITAESVAITRLILDIYRDFGFEDVRIKYADRPPQRVGSDEVWDRAEEALKVACRAAGIDFTPNPGEGAFYGPKLEFVLRDAIGRDWQCGTLQVDFNMPGRLGAYYIDEHSRKRTPVMLHRAMFGSLERFFAILLEHHAGRLPAWLAPVQAVVMSITDRQDEYVRSVTESLKNQGVLAVSDLRNEKVGFKIREHTLQRVPYLLVAGEREVAAQLLSVRTRSGKDLGTMTLEAFMERFRIELSSRGRRTLED